MGGTGQTSRRGFLKGTAAVAAGAAGLSLGTGVKVARAQSVRGGRGGRARNVVFMVADGMSQGVWTMADMASRQLHGRRSAWASLYMGGAPVTQMMTHSANSLVTDSAAAGSAWGSGVHIDNGVINQRDGRDLEPILVTARDRGMATGLVTTTRVTHATPASFVANVPSRNMEDEIAGQMLDRRVDLILGGGARHFSDDLLSKHEDLAVVRDTAGLRAAAMTEGRLLGLFNGSHMSYDLDRPETEPHLKEMSLVALKHLAAKSKGGRGFVLQIEGGRVDHAGHGNDAPGNLFDQIAFDDAVEAVVGWARRRGDTLVLVMTDHGCGGPELTLYGDEGNEGFAKLLKAKSSVTAAQIAAGREQDRVVKLVAELRERMGVELAMDEIDHLERVLVNDAMGDGFSGSRSDSAVIGSVLANHWGVAFVSGNHTAEMVHATAVGPGSELLRPVMDNIDFYGVVVEALGLRG
ncbi:alkaline phosphatase [Mucisphaera sp.]|uniref:alkaline phosphatase n=1 Tax=Mucisphaera sp. TaxID=2913024 RepID=UPI003D107FE3